MKFFQKGFSNILIIGIIAAIVLIGAGIGGYFYYQKWQRDRFNEQNPNIAPPQFRDDTSTWQTYRNEKYGFEVKIPQSWKTRVEESTNILLGTEVEAIHIFVFQNKENLTIREWLFSQERFFEVKDVGLVGGVPVVKDERGVVWFVKERRVYEVFNGSVVIRKLIPDSIPNEKFDAILSTFRFVPSINSGQGSPAQKDIIYFSNPAYTGWTEAQMKADCQNRGGTFNPCGSACLDPAEVCIQVCAPRCEFKER